MSIEEMVISYQKESDKNILEKIIEKSNSFIKNLSVYYYRKNSKNILLEDVKSSAIEGLIIAINKYDYDKNKNFEPYARLWIKAKIRQFLLKNITPFSINDKVGRLNFANFHRITDKGSKGYVSFLDAVNLTYQEPDEENYMSSSLTPEQTLLKKEQSELFDIEIISFQEKINDVEKCILKERLLSDNPLTLEQISVKFECTNQNIAYKEKKVMEKFKKHILNSKYREVFQAGTLVA